MKLRRFTALQTALGASLAVHAVLLTVRFVDPESFNRVFQDAPLEVILVNARTTEKSDRARAIAQASLAGGGAADQGRASSPLPRSERADDGEIQDEAVAGRLRNLQEQQALLLTQIKNQLAALQPPDPNTPVDKAELSQREEKRRQLATLLAEIERRINNENARPKKRYISPSTREEVYALYYDKLRRSIEDRGTENFPTEGGKRLYGELTMIVTVNHDGRVLRAEVVQGSGNRALDRQATAIALSAGPFGPFNKAMRLQADQILVVSRFKFTREETLETQMSTQP